MSLLDIIAIQDMQIRNEKLDLVKEDIKEKLEEIQSKMKEKRMLRLH